MNNKALIAFIKKVANTHPDGNPEYIIREAQQILSQKPKRSKRKNRYKVYTELVDFDESQHLVVDTTKDEHEEAAEESRIASCKEKRHANILAKALNSKK